MPGKNTTGGKGYKRAKQSSGFEEKKVLMTVDDGQQFAQVIKRAGGQFVDVKCADGKHRKAYLRGAIRRRVWLEPGDIIIVSFRDFSADDKKCDIIHKYSTDERRQLELSALLPDDFVEKKKSYNDNIEFENENENDDDDSDSDNITKENEKQENSSDESENDDELNDDIDIDNI